MIVVLNVGKLWAELLVVAMSPMCGQDDWPTNQILVFYASKRSGTPDVQHPARTFGFDFYLVLLCDFLRIGPIATILHYLSRLTVPYIYFPYRQSSSSVASEDRTSMKPWRWTVVGGIGAEQRVGFLIELLELRRTRFIDLLWHVIISSGSGYGL